MAFDALKPHQSQIVGLADQGRTLAQIADILAAQHGVNTTPGTLSRFITSLRPSPKHRPTITPPPVEPPPLTPEQHARVDSIALATELLAEIHASRRESRDILEQLAGKVAALSADVVEVERAVERNAQAVRDHVSNTVSAIPPVVAPDPSIHAALLVRIWSRALLITALVWAIAIGLALNYVQLG